MKVSADLGALIGVDASCQAAQRLPQFCQPILSTNDRLRAASYSGIVVP